MDELIKEYKTLYQNMSTSADVNKMRIFGKAAQWAFEQMSQNNPQMAQKWLEKLKSIEWNNYLTKEEAEKIVSELVSQNGAKGGKWSYSQFTEAVTRLNKPIEMQPFFNSYALWATANMRYSDNAQSALDFGITEDKLPAYFYTVAVENLTDADRPRFVREYFNL